MKNILRVILYLTMTLVLMSCGGEAVRLAAQKFEGNIYQIEVRPGPTILKGMNEFLVIVSNKHNQPVADLIVSLRTNNKSGWKQMIQDGRVGVYRRAIEIKNPQTGILQLQVRKEKDELTVLKFPLNLTQQ